MCFKVQNWQRSLAFLSLASTDIQNDMDYEMYLLFSSDNWPWKADALKIAWGGVKGRRNVPKVVHFGILQGLMLGAVFQNFISLSI